MPDEGVRLLLERLRIMGEARAAHEAHEHLGLFLEVHCICAMGPRLVILVPFLH